MKAILQLFSVLVVAGLLVSCGKSGGSGGAQAPDPATQPEAQAAVFQRTCDRVKGLIANKEFKQAQDTLNGFKNFKLTPEQEKFVEQLQTQIPKTN